MLDLWSENIGVNSMLFLNSFWKFFWFGGEEFVRRKLVYKNIIRDVDFSYKWEIIGELGDGVFGKVYKVSVWLGRIFDIFLLWFNLYVCVVILILIFFFEKVLLLVKNCFIFCFNFWRFVVLSYV